MKTVKIEAFMDIDDDAIENLKKIEHHADYLFDLDSYPEIRDVYGVQITEVEGEN